jgi:anti-sigma-K factor RskA
VSEIRRYLLGQLGDRDREAVEERLFADDTFALLVEAEEDELIDAYVSGRLRSGERRAWEAYREARPDVVRREAFARALQKRFEVGRRPVIGWQIAAAAAVLLIGLFVGLPERGMDVRLEAGTLRGSEAAQVVRIGSGVKKLRVNFGNGTAVRGTIVAVDTGRAVWSGPIVKGVAEVPALAAGDYVGTVMDEKGEELADYGFRVER